VIRLGALRTALSFLKRERGISLADPSLRNWKWDDSISSDTFVKDLRAQHKVQGLDWFVNNKGTSSITVTIDNGKAQTVNARGAKGQNNTEFSRIEVSSGTFDVNLAGRYL